MYSVKKIRQPQKLIQPKISQGYRIFYSCT